MVVAYRALFEPTCTLQPLSVPSPGQHGLDSLTAGQDYQIPGRCVCICTRFSEIPCDGIGRCSSMQLWHSDLDMGRQCGKPT